jgi:phosphatidate cytidylyltransferase
VLAGLLAIDHRLPFMIFLAVCVGLTLFEWLRLTQPGMGWLWPTAGAALGLFCAWLAWQWLQAPAYGLSGLLVALIITSLVWVTAAPWQLWTAKIDFKPVWPLWSLFAPVCLLATFGGLALIWLHQGVWQLLSLLAVIWVADILAYFGGRRFGKHKLAAQISPGKTREGALFGVAAVVAWMALTAPVTNSYAWLVWQRWGWLGVILSALLLGALAVMGDLFESYLKRQANRKDSSGLLPGHGGVYDRVDAVVAVIPVATILVWDF